MIGRNRIIAAASAVGVAWLVFSCDKEKSDIPGPAATAPIAEVKLVAPPDTVAFRPTTRPGIIQPGDWIRISVDDLITEKKATVLITRVNADGTANFPLVAPIKVAGLNDSEAELLADKAYKAANIIADAHAMVRRIYLARPGEPAPGPLHPFDLVRIDVMDLQSAGMNSTTIGRISSDGRIEPPQLKSIKVADLTSAAAAMVISKAYKDTEMISNACVEVTTLEAAPPNAEHLDLPDGPVYPVPEALRPLFVQ